MIKAVIFDMDGLIFDSERLYAKANVKTAKTLGLDKDEAYFYQFVGIGAQDMAERMKEAFDDDLVDEFFRLGEKDVHELLLHGEVPTQPGLYELLDYLDDAGIEKVIASSSEVHMIDIMTKNAGIRDRFSAIHGGDQVEQTKPAPDIFELAWSNLGVSKEETLVLEDSINGVLAAHAAGIPVIMVPDTVEPTDEVRDKALAVVNNLSEVANYLKQNR
ncbi:hypothetical protein B8A40_02250 [Dolosigranulum pigrum]|uniref:HAD family hydrolase n=1 Tax=Dolosigranulum pigrum TaxID=29394 RepID=UPI000DC51BCD|nr:HAD family phosphatase [Dolosigranulum pigrum]RAN59507.1 hypothetical protein B8A40_02250 [Dolosigranulum pigrum]